MNRPLKNGRIEITVNIASEAYPLEYLDQKWITISKHNAQELREAADEIEAYMAAQREEVMS